MGGVGYHFAINFLLYCTILTEANMYHFHAWELVEASFMA